MSNEVTLGGERLGSGKRMKVELHGFERSSHDLSYIWRSTMSAGTLVPFMKEVALPGDTFDIDLNIDVKTHPTIGPLFGSYKVQLDVFVVPIRLYHSALHNNALNIGLNMASIKLPKFRLPYKLVTNDVKDFDNFQINPSCIFSYLDIRGVGIVNEAEGSFFTQTRNFNAVPFCAFWDIYKQYYSNKQEEEGVVIHTPGGINITFLTSVSVGGNVLSNPPSLFGADLAQGVIDVNIAASVFEPQDCIIVFSDSTLISLDQLAGGYWQGTGAANRTGVVASAYVGKTILGWRYRVPADVTISRIRLQRFPLANIDTLRAQILASSATAEYFVPNSLTPYGLALDSAQPGLGDSLDMSASYSQEGLPIKTYQSDLFNNWLSTDWIDGAGGINDITKVSTVGDEFTIDALNLARKVYDMLNRIAVSDGSYDAWLRAVYDHESFTRAESPVYLGGLIRELVFQEVVNNSGSEAQPLGTLAGKGVMSSKNKGGKVVARIDEPSYIMGIVSLTPRLDYSQGNKWDVGLETLDDLHKPNLDQIGFQELITEQMAWWSTNKIVANDTPQTKSAGKQPAWVNYMTNVNEVRGNFAIEDNEQFMVLVRRYEPEALIAIDNYQIGDLTTYVDPTKFNHIFADTSLDSQNFWVQISADITARRKMSAKVMPNL